MDNFQSNCMIQQLCDVLIFCILYFVGIFKCSLLFVNKLKWKQKFVDDFYIVVLLLSSLLECMPSKFTMFSCWLTFETNKRKKRDYVAVILYILFSQSLFSAKLMNNVLQVSAVLFLFCLRYKYLSLKIKL